MKKNCTHHPPCRVNVNPKRESRSTDTRIPTIPSPCGVSTCPRIIDTRLLVRAPNNYMSAGIFEIQKEKNEIYKNTND